MAVAQQAQFAPPCAEVDREPRRGVAVPIFGSGGKDDPAGNRRAAHHRVQEKPEASHRIDGSDIGAAGLMRAHRIHAVPLAGLCRRHILAKSIRRETRRRPAGIIAAALRLAGAGCGTVRRVGAGTRSRRRGDLAWFIVPNGWPRCRAIRWRGLLRGIEKESLRVRPDGALATTPHPRQLGSALTHPHITTDFSESQLELITGVDSTVHACLAELTEIHQFVYRMIGDELLWAGSMPCRLPADDDIPIGRYGKSNIGRLKTIYRLGLSRRYGSQDADDFGHPLQLFAAGGRDGGAAVAGVRRPADRRVPHGAVFWRDPQFPAPFVAAAVPVRRLARGVPLIRRGSFPSPPDPFRRHAVSAARDVVADGSVGLSERRTAQARRELQQSRSLCVVAQSRIDRALCPL